MGVGERKIHWDTRKGLCKVCNVENLRCQHPPTGHHPATFDRLILSLEKLPEELLEGAGVHCLGQSNLDVGGTKGGGKSRRGPGAPRRDEVARWEVELSGVPPETPNSIKHPETNCLFQSYTAIAILYRASAWAFAIDHMGKTWKNPPTDSRTEIAPVWTAPRHWATPAGHSSRIFLASKRSSRAVGWQRIPPA